MALSPPPGVRYPLPGMPASAFQHPMDRQTGEQLGKMRGFDFLAAKYLEFGFERIAYVHNVGSSIRVGPKQLSGLHDMLVECCNILDVALPELYVQQGRMYAFTFGHTRPYIVLSSGMLDLLDDAEIMSVIAHEVGHIKCGHVLYKTMAASLTPLFSRVPLPAHLVYHGVRAAFMAWDRCSEYSADRASLLVMQDARPCQSALMKTAGGSGRWQSQLSLDQFLEQANSFRENLDETTLDKLYSFFVTTSTTHPLMIDRARALNEWIVSEEYRKLVDWAKAVAK